MEQCREMMQMMGGGESTAQRILQERLARGEIDREEYQERLSTLQRRSPRMT